MEDQKDYVHQKHKYNWNISNNSSASSVSYTPLGGTDNLDCNDYDYDDSYKTLTPPLLMLPPPPLNKPQELIPRSFFKMLDVGDITQKGDEVKKDLVGAWISAPIGVKVEKERMFRRFTALPPAPYVKDKETFMQPPINNLS